MLTVRFWGVRGSLPTPGIDTVIYGGNTSCLEIRADERLLIVDLGSGARPLGDWLMKNDFAKYGKIKADIFLTHTHWDHIMGFPMFNPVYVPGNELRITGPVTLESENLKSVIGNQLSYQYWPVRADELSANIEYNEIKETTLNLGDGLSVTSKFLNHPIFCLGFRFNYKGKSIATVFDHEPYRNLFTSENDDEEAQKEGEEAAAEENEKIKDFIKGADIVIHDAQYTNNEYTKRIGWGHSSNEQGVELTKDAGVKKLVFYHHEPQHTDKELEEIEKSYAQTNRHMEIIMAKEGLTLQA
ncbi:MAG: MBL fold metallo-hydrolase [Treponema sp.]|nr:MBL fold metallo-hydrolase [Treponema sp.]